ncbi:MAG: hypothetical protein OWV35_04940 [Firmicutes bacterium]|nr:hypothetical protein [Bacillota bacterium]
MGHRGGFLRLFYPAAADFYGGFPRGRYTGADRNRRREGKVVQDVGMVLLSLALFGLLMAFTYYLERL